MKKIQLILASLLLSLALNVHGQITSAGGGGTGGYLPSDAHDILQAKMKALKKDISAWLKVFKKDWSDCYGKKLTNDQSSNLIDLHIHLSVTALINPPKAIHRRYQIKKNKKEEVKADDTNKPDGDCSEQTLNTYSCVFQNTKHNQELGKILDNPLLEDALDAEKEDIQKIIHFFKAHLKEAGRNE